jgi:N-acetylneuraminic acid mutarotase
MSDKLLFLGGGYPKNEDRSRVLDVKEGTVKLGRHYPISTSMHASVRLSDTQVLITGGVDHCDYGTDLCVVYEAERFKKVNPMREKRHNHAITTMADATILVSGGYNDSSGSLDTMEIMTDGMWHGYPVRMWSRLLGHCTVTLPNAKILFIGGTNGHFTVPYCSLLDPDYRRFEMAASMCMPRVNHTATYIGHGLVLVAGGNKTTSPNQTMYNDDTDGTWEKEYKEMRTASCEIYNIVDDKWYTTDPMNFKRAGHTATLLSTGVVLVIGGTENTTRCEMYLPSIRIWKLLEFLADVPYDKCFFTCVKL